MLLPMQALIRLMYFKISLFGKNFIINTFCLTVLSTYFNLVRLIIDKAEVWFNLAELSIQLEV